MNLSHLAELCERATPGPWRELERCGNADPDDACEIVSDATCCDALFPGQPCPRARHHKVTVFKSDAYDECSHPIRKVDAEFIAACDPTTVAKLLRVVRAAEEWTAYHAKCINATWTDEALELFASVRALGAS